jgi:tetratricopeptide (TPR) repeat protein
VAVLGLTSGATAQIAVELRFDGNAFEPTARPDISCFSDTLGRWVSCRVQKDAASGAYLVERLAPGSYRMHVSIDENAANPRRFPGDYEAQLPFDVAATGPERLTVDVARLIHVTRPADNGRSLEGMLLGCATQPRFDTPRLSWRPTAEIDFAWEPIVDGAEYRYSVAVASCGTPYRERPVLSRTTGAAAMTLTLPPSAEGEYYVVRLEAWKGGRVVGALYTHDGGAHSWNYRVRVHDASVPQWAYLAAGAGVLLLLLGVRRFFSVEPAVRRRRIRRVAWTALVLIAVAAAAGAGYSYRHERERRRVEAERARVEAERQARQREFVAAFASAAPRPTWWDEVATPYRVDNVGDLLAAWQGHRSGDEGRGERQFFKAAYQGIVDHPDDEHVVATAIDLMGWVDRDYPHRLPLARFGYERYFAHRRRTDNCANCMPGDTTQGLAQTLSQLLIEAARYDEAIDICRRLLDARGADVSPYKLAETWDRVAWAYWNKGERERASEIAREALTKYGATVRGEVLRNTLARFERGG